MAELTTKKRNKLKKSSFGLPEDKKYPMPDKAHASNAKARARQQLDKGNLSYDEYKQIVKKANKKLRETGAKTISKIKNRNMYTRK